MRYNPDYSYNDAAERLNFYQLEAEIEKIIDKYKNFYGDEINAYTYTQLYGKDEVSLYSYVDLQASKEPQLQKEK